MPADMGLAAEWCGPKLQGSSVTEVVTLRVGGEDLTLVLTGFGRRGAGPPLLLSGGALAPLALPEDDTLPRIGKVWAFPGPPGDSVLVSGPDGIYELTIAPDRSTTAELLVALPETTDSVDVWIAPDTRALTVAVFDDRCEPIHPDDPRVEPPPPRPLDVCVWSSTSPTWRDLCQTPRESGGLAVSATAAVWLAYNSYISEESSAGAYYGIKLDAPGSAMECLTPSDSSLPLLQSGMPPAGAGKVRAAAFTPDGSSLILHANFSVVHAVTAACGLWACAWPAGPALSRTRLTEAGHEIQKFGWGGEGRGIWATALEGVDRRTFFLSGDEIGASISTNVALTSTGVVVYGLDTPDEFPAVWQLQKQSPPQLGSLVTFNLTSVTTSLT